MQLDGARADGDGEVAARLTCPSRGRARCAQIQKFGMAQAIELNGPAWIRPAWFARRRGGRRPSLRLRDRARADSRVPSRRIRHHLGDGPAATDL
jgi:hypothetical protein